MVEAIRAGDIPGVQLRSRRRMPVATAGELWPWLVESARLRHWLADEVEEEGSSPDRLVLRSQSKTGEITESVRTLALERPTSWTFDLMRQESGWRSSTRVAIELAAMSDGCEISVFQQGFQHLSLSICLSVWEEYRGRWAQALERLEAAIGQEKGKV